jgi:competence protein ComEC
MTEQHLARLSAVCLTLLALLGGALTAGCSSTSESVTQSSVALPASVSSSATAPAAAPSTTSAAPSTTTSQATTTTTQATVSTVSITTTSSPSTTTTLGGSPLEIVTVTYNAPGNDDNNNLNEEYVVFKVLVSTNLLGYAIEDEYGHRYDFPDRTFEKGQTFTLHSGEGTDTQTDLYWGARGSAIWNNDSDTVKVLDPGGDVVTSHSY